MMELPLVFLSGLLGSSHCIGMCGGFALSIGIGARNWQQNLARQGLYTAGRMFTYSFAGALAAFAGVRLTRQFASVGGIDFQSILSILAGLLLVIQGASVLGFRWPWRQVKGGGACAAGKIFRTFLTAPGWSSAFLAGVLTGFLPCVLVYANLALAASSGTVAQGALLMAVFGAGTGPLMMLTGCGGSLLSHSARQSAFRLAAACVIITGGLSISRGMAYYGHTPGANQQCPACHPQSQ